MSFLIIDRERYALQMGETTLGGNADDVLAMSPLAALPPFAVLAYTADGSGTIGRLGYAMDVVVDGVALGPEPRALRHGAQIEVAGYRILYGEMRTVGATFRVAGVTDDELALLSGFAPSEGTSATGGQLVARDGAVHRITDAGLEIGRDPSCGLVLATKDVSRRHAVVGPSLLGYTISDVSTNGVFVNGTRIEGAQLLGQGDVIRLGSEEFRFEADAASFEPALTSASPASEPMALPQKPLPNTEPPAASSPPAAPAAAIAGSQNTPPVVLASLEVVTDGVLHGTRFRIKRPVVQLGRGAHNDVRIADASVSGAHATLLQRSGKWVVLDLGSSNGTYVDGERVTEGELPRACDLRVGNIKMIFRQIASTTDESKGTLGIVGVTNEQLRRR